MQYRNGINKMKKIMILGGGPNQIGLLNSAKQCGYATILCDKNANCLGRDLADIFYGVDIIDVDEVLNVAQQEEIDGIISNSEVVMEVVAEVSSKLGLVGNSKNSIATLNSKQGFRDFQKENGIFTPKHITVSSDYILEEVLSGFNYPVIVKPVKCSGTRGTTRFDYYSEEDMKAAIDSCINFSRNNMCAIEEYIEMPSLTVLEGDVFVNGGEIFWGGVFFTRRSETLPMVPMTYMSPYTDSNEHFAEIKSVLKKTFECLPIKHGQYNVEAYFDAKDNFFIIEINARQGGHGLPAYVKRATGVDMDKLLVTTAVGDNQYFDEVLTPPVRQKYATRHAVFGDQDGVLEEIYIDESIKKYVVEIEYDKKIGECVEKWVNGSSVIGFVNLVFENYEMQHLISENIEKYIYPIINVGD